MFHDAIEPALDGSSDPDPPGNLLARGNGGGSGLIGMYNWQSTKMTVKERLAFMFNNEILADVHFIVGRER